MAASACCAHAPSELRHARPYESDWKATLRAAMQSAKLFNAAGAQIGSNTVTLGPLGQAQPALSSFFGAAATGGGLWMTVEQTSVTPTADGASFDCADGCPGFFIYASILDNVTQDPTTLEAQFSVPLTPQAINIIFPAGKVPSRAAKH